jgi:Holliday junction resolvase RusA-like endonuclease
MSGRSWVLDFPRPDEWISANERTHWAVKAAKVRSWRQAAAVHARAAKIPQLARASVLVEPCWTTARRLDPANLAPTSKACLDGLTDAGVWLDDDSEHVVAVTFKRGPRVKGLARLRLTITELSIGDPE